ncbi:MAG: AMP-binding protein, partial [Leptospiraceae bacterium]|nr:AMP-binding protein [Leptospiraceae bacterium]
MESGNERIGDYLFRQCDFYSDLIALRFLRDGRQIKITYAQLQELGVDIGVGLLKAGLWPGARAALVGTTTPEWVIAFCAVHFAGMIDVSYDDHADSGVILNLIRETECRVLFSDRAHLLEELVSILPGVTLVHLSWKIVDRSAGYITLADLRKRGRRAGGKLRRLQKAREERLHADPASILYKRPDPVHRTQHAVVQTHHNILFNVQSLASIFPVSENDTILMSQPLSHSSGRMGLYLAFDNAAPLCLSAPDSFLDDLNRYEPTIILAGPTMLALFMQRIRAGSTGESLFNILMRRLYLRVSRLWQRLEAYIFEEKGEPGQTTDPLNWLTLFFIIPLLALLFPARLLGDFLYRHEIRKALGTRVRAIISGGAQFPDKLDSFFQTMGVPVLAGYWMTEAAHVIACRRLEYTGQRSRLRPGTV